MRNSKALIAFLVLTGVLLASMGYWALPAVSQGIQQPARVYGSFATNDCAKLNASGFVVSNGSACGSGGGGSPAGSSGDIQYNNAGAFGGRAPSGNGTTVVTTTGTQTAGRCVVIDANGNHVADSGSCGSGGTSTHYFWYPGAYSDGGTGSARSVISGNCTTDNVISLNTVGTTIGLGKAIEAGCTTTIYFELPSTWDGNAPTLNVDTLLATTSTNTYSLTPVSQCYTPGVDAYGSGSNNTGTTVTTTPTGTSLQQARVTLTLPITNCTAGDVMVFGFTRSNADSYNGDVFYTGVRLSVVY